MPRAGTAGLDDAAQQRRAAVTEANGREPAFRRQFAAPGDLRLEPFHHHRAGPAVDGEAKAEHAHPARLEGRLLKEAPRRLMSIEQFLKQVAQLGHSGLVAAFQNLFQSFNHE